MSEVDFYPEGWDRAIAAEDGASGAVGSFKAHIFASYKGGTGKTTILFHAAAQYAMDHPRENVLVVDCSMTGDISERLLGGTGAKGGKTAGHSEIESLYDEGRSAEHLFQFLNANLVMDTDMGKRRSFFSKLRDLAVAPDPSSCSSSEASTPRQGQLTNVVDEFGIPVSYVNPMIELDNLFLIPGGGGLSREEPCLGIEGLDNIVAIRRLSKTLRAHLMNVPGVWRVFFDTDGKLAKSSTVQVVTCSSDSIALFTEADTADFRRIEEFIDDLMRGKKRNQAVGKPCAGIGVVCFNKVERDIRRRPFQEFGCAISPQLPAMKDLMRSFAFALTKSVIVENRAQGLHLFTNTPPPLSELNQNARMHEFLHKTFLVMQNFHTSGIVGNTLGVPFCCMNTWQTYQGDHGHYEVESEALLESLKDNVRELNIRL